MGLTIGKEGAAYAAVECRSMVVGAVALGVYSAIVCVLLARRRTGPLSASSRAMLGWFAVAFGGWFLFLR